MISRTTTMFKMTRSKLIKLGFNENFNDGKLTLGQREYAYLTKMMRFDDDIYTIVTEYYFAYFSFSDLEVDRKFKKLFFTKFLQYDINAQTMESFSLDVNYTSQMLEDYIIKLYKDLDKFLSNDTVVKGNRVATTTDDNRTLQTDLSDDNINLDVDETVLDYGHTNTINRSKNLGVSNDETTSSRFSVDEFIKSQSLLDDVLSIYGKNCF